jgi:hypothetical protein
VRKSSFPLTVLPQLFFFLELHTNSNEFQHTLVKNFKKAYKLVLKAWEICATPSDTKSWKYFYEEIQGLMLSKVKDNRLTTEFVRQWCDILLEITREVIIKMVAKETEENDEVATPLVDKLLSMIPDMTRFVNDGTKYQAPIRNSTLDQFVCLFNTFLNLFPALQAQRAGGGLQFEIIKSVCKVVEVWATVIAPEGVNASYQWKIMEQQAQGGKGRDKSGREKMVNFSIDVLHKISPSTILSWFGPWLFTFAKGLHFSLDDVGTKTRATALKWICRLICVQSDKDPKSEHVVEFCSLINSAINSADRTLIGTIVDNTAGLWGRSLSGMTAILSHYVKCIVFVLKDQRDFFSEENRVSRRALTGATSIVCFPSHFRGLDREILPSAKNPMHRPSLQHKLSSLGGSKKSANHFNTNVNRAGSVTSRSDEGVSVNSIFQTAFEEILTNSNKECVDLDGDD